MSDSEITAARESLMALIEIRPDDLKPGILMPSKLLARRLLEQLDDEGRRKSGMALRTSIERYLSEHPIEEILRKDPEPIPANAETMQSCP